MLGGCLDVLCAVKHQWKLKIDPIILFMKNEEDSELASPTRSPFSNCFEVFFVFKLTNSCEAKHVSLLLGFDSNDTTLLL